MKRLWIIVFLLVSPGVSNAVIDMKNSNYAESWMDMVLPGSGYELKVQRYYNSRSNFSGIFGYGWCSDFETSLQKTAEGGLLLQECGAGQETTYTLGKGESKSAAQTVDAIIAYLKKTNPSDTADFLATARTQLLSNPGERARLAKEAGLATPEAKKGQVYSADTMSVEQIVFDGTSYVRTLADGTSQKFDPAGHLIYMYDKNSNYLKITYSGDTIREVADNNSRKLAFTFYNNKRVKEITGPVVGKSVLKAEYKYKGEDLTEVQNMWTNKYAFHYDDASNPHNLTKVDFPDGTFKSLSYIKSKDLVASFTDRAVNGVTCVESYAYDQDPKDPRDHFWSTAVKKCGKEVKNTARFEFWHKRKADGSKYLARVLTKSNTDSLDVTYHPDFGRPEIIHRNGTTTTFSYYPTGLVHTKGTEGAKMTYEYKNTFNKVSKVYTEFYDSGHKVARKRETEFQYDAKANLNYASNSDGQNVHLSYDAHGRIASITDQAKKEVTIKYEERLGKPSQITRPKVGTITVSYKANGDILKVDSKDGPTVAVQVASTFNNLLDIIAPATSELNL
jgi:YD repeat-containing protein